MTKSLEIILASALLLTACSFQKGRHLDCNTYRKGSFIQNIYNNSGHGHWTKAEILIERNDSIESHVVRMLPKDTIFYTIRWRENCNYELHFLKATNTLADTIIRYYSKRPVQKYSIQKVTDTYYTEKMQRKVDTIWLRH